MKLVVTDGYTINPGDLSWEPLKEFGELVVFDHSPRDEDEMIRRIGDADILVANKAKVSRRVIDACPNLKFITIQAAGYDAIDYQYAKEKGIPLSNVPDYGSAAVAQYAIALLLEICGSVGHHVEAVRQGRWAESGEWCFWDYPMIELAGKTMGIVGYGRIGACLGDIAQALGMKVLAYRRHPQPELESPTLRFTTLDELLASSDFVSLHTPAIPGKPLMDRENIAKMKDGAVLINTSRGANVDEEALLEALNTGKLRAAGLDVWAQEPTKNEALYNHPRVSCTPHIGAATAEAQARVGSEVVGIIRDFFA